MAAVEHQDNVNNPLCGRGAHEKADGEPMAPESLQHTESQADLLATKSEDPAQLEHATGKRADQLRVAVLLAIRDCDGKWGLAWPTMGQRHDQQQELAAPNGKTDQQEGMTVDTAALGQ